MQAVVKTLHTEILIKGNISEKVLSALMEEYGSAFNIVENEDDDLVNVFETEWYQSVKAKTLPGDFLRIYRENKGLTQAELGKKLGGIPRQHISNMERGQRSISINIARKLSEILNVSVERFI
ncbi:MAG: XRE family transcriptional regulator [Deltaproteobacteria bacterium]|nr:MAG: XRE family transcriptional regulator [Deltaproteobacteria bacterium]